LDREGVSRRMCQRMEVGEGEGEGEAKEKRKVKVHNETNTH
jgi:hypothetical protein